ncbi:hypothetical protein L1049_028266 [Liquidambar formosana]|uniref:Uncharacterized protein n=1 Tax=Liquidambar formosana TaxID=63359 RepID=A0AAP0WT87_LIQFO
MVDISTTSDCSIDEKHIEISGPSSRNEDGVENAVNGIGGISEATFTGSFKGSAVIALVRQYIAQPVFPCSNDQSSFQRDESSGDRCVANM